MLAATRETANRAQAPAMLGLIGRLDHITGPLRAGHSQGCEFGAGPATSVAAHVELDREALLAVLGDGRQLEHAELGDASAEAHGHDIAGSCTLGG